MYICDRVSSDLTLEERVQQANEILGYHKSSHGYIVKQGTFIEESWDNISDGQPITDFKLYVHKQSANLGVLGDRALIIYYRAYADEPRVPIIDGVYILPTLESTTYDHLSNEIYRYLTTEDQVRLLDTIIRTPEWTLFNCNERCK